MTTPMDRLLSAVEWRDVPLPDDAPHGIPYTTHAGELRIGPVTLRVYQLSTGQRIIDRDDLARFFDCDVIDMIDALDAAGKDGR